MANKRIYIKWLGVLISIFTIQSCVNQRFRMVEKFKSNTSIGKKMNGFFGLNDTLINGQLYKRFLLINENNLVIDGYWSMEETNDTIYLIPYNSIRRNCNDRLVFFIRKTRDSHYLGRSCENELQYPTDVLVRYEDDTIIDNISYHRFSHSIIGEDDYSDGSDAIISERHYLINDKLGLILDRTLNEDFDLYWYNY